MVSPRRLFAVAIIGMFAVVPRASAQGSENETVPLNHQDGPDAGRPGTIGDKPDASHRPDGAIFIIEEDRSKVPAIDGGLTPESRVPEVLPSAPNVRTSDEVQLDEVVIGTGQKEKPVPAVVETQTAKEIERINVVSSADAFKYVPNLHVRKLQAGSVSQPIALRGNTATTAGPRTLVLVDGLQITNYISGSMSDSPKWQMVSAEEISAFDVIYGPFSAAYGGNSFSGTVLITTRMPQRLELRTGADVFLQTMHVYSTDVNLPGYHVNASAGDRQGKFSYVLSYDRVQALDQPISFYSLGTAGVSTSNPVTGALPDTDATGKARTIVGSQGPMATINNTAKLKLGYDVTPWSELRFTLGFWHSQTKSNEPDSYLKDASGNNVFAGQVDVDGQGYTLPNNTFTYQKSGKQELFYGLTYKVTHASGLKAWAGVSYYDTVKDLTQVSSTAPEAAKDGGAGTVTDKNTGSWIADGNLSYRVDLIGTHTLAAGYHFDRFNLESEAWNASDWLRDTRTTLSKREQGATRTHAAFIDDLWQIRTWWSVYLGGRFEWWRAFDGEKATDSTDGRIIAALPAASDQSFSPKISTTFSPFEQWSLRLSLGVANRYPTVGELFYGGINTNGTISNGNPDLKRERNTAKDVTVSRGLSDGGQVRLSFFQDDVNDAIFSQTNSYTNTTYYQNVDKVRTRGAELSGNVRKLPLAGLGLSGSLGLNDSEILENANVPASVGKQFPRVPRWRAKLGIDYTTQERWLVFFGGNYASRAYYTLDNSDTGSGYGAVDSYLVLDARVSFRISKYLIADAGIDNLTNRLYFEYHTYPGRTFHLGVKAGY
jgi:iron complex outermembrane receptor protein